LPGSEARDCLETARLTLEPLRADHAEEMAGLLDDVRLHEFTGGRPLTLADLNARYERLGSVDTVERGWLNWIARERAGGSAVGTVQATVSWPEGSAELAWVVGVEFQGRGYATEAARGVLEWLRHRGVASFVVHVHPEHHASAGVAGALGLVPVGVRDDGEERWERGEGEVVVDLGSV
jgi:RimJ/RimL family protein N-acetyltransferase